ncbi:four-carbon acid sugar kinase family protein, partial [Billgrantia ethanolica]
TGALDAAAPFAARGAQARVVIAPERLEAALSAWGEAPPEVIAVNTESRHLPAAEAAERVATVTRRLAPYTPTVWFKKVDSTLRGQVVAESLAM